MIKFDSNGITLPNTATSQDVLNLAQAIVTAREIRLSGGRIVSDHVINNMIDAMVEATESYRKSIKESCKDG